MRIIVDTTKYEKCKGAFTYNEMQKMIKDKFDVDMSISSISRTYRGINKSYKNHALISNILGLDITEVYQWKN